MIFVIRGDFFFTAFGGLWYPVDDGVLAGALLGVRCDGRTQAVGQLHLAGADVVEAVQVELLGVHHTVAL